jgi:hypothetical protein
MKTMLCVCLGMLALSASASAQQQECFEVVMTNATGGGSLGSILINKCTGNTWVLTRTQAPNGTTTNRWFPISVEKSEATTSNPPNPPSR